MQKISRADTDTDTIFAVFTDTVSVDGYLYPSDPHFVSQKDILNVVNQVENPQETKLFETIKMF